MTFVMMKWTKLRTEKRNMMHAVRNWYKCNVLYGILKNFEITIGLFFTKIVWNENVFLLFFSLPYAFAFCSVYRSHYHSAIMDFFRVKQIVCIHLAYGCKCQSGRSIKKTESALFGIKWIQSWIKDIHNSYLQNQFDPL